MRVMICYTLLVLPQRCCSKILKKVWHRK